MDEHFIEADGAFIHCRSSDVCQTFPSESEERTEF